MHFLLLAVLLLHVPAHSGALSRVPPAEAGGQTRATKPAPPTPSPAAVSRLREESVESAALKRAMPYRVLVPADYDTTLRRYPVLYLLHGLFGNYRDWTTRTNIADYSHSLPLIIVMPDGNNGWYTNSDEGAFETFLASDLPNDVVAKYRTINSRYGRAIAGLSMGGYGAVKLALKRPGAFAVAASFSGALNATRPGELDQLIGGEEGKRLQRVFGAADSEARRENDVVRLAATQKPGAAAYVYVDCGIADNGLIGANRDFIAALHKAGVAYEYHEVAGAHTWDYWDRRVRDFLPLLMKKLAN